MCNHQHIHDTSDNLRKIWALLGMFSGEGNGNLLQYHCLENSVDRGAWWAAVHRVAQSQTQLKWLSMHACIGEGNGNPLQYSCLENPRDGGAWWAAIYGGSHRVGYDWSNLAKQQQECLEGSGQRSGKYIHLGVEQIQRSLKKRPGRNV